MQMQVCSSLKFSGGVAFLRLVYVLYVTVLMCYLFCIQSVHFFGFFII